MNANVNKKKSSGLERRWLKSVIMWVAKPTFLKTDKFWDKVLLHSVVSPLNEIK